MVQPDLKERASQLQKELKVSIYQFEIGGLQFLFRPLTIDELSLATGKFDPAELEDHYVSTATLYPENFDVNKVKAGYITRYADEILHVSGFDDPQVIIDFMESYRNAADTHNAILSMKAFILSVMTIYRSEELDQLNIEQLVEKLVLAEKIVAVQQGILGMEPDGFKLSFVDSNAAVEEAPPPKKVPVNPGRNKVVVPPKPKEKVVPGQKVVDDDYAKEKLRLIKQIAADNATTVTADKRVDVDYSELEELSVGELQRVAGITKATDPIAQQLKANENMQRRVARSIGLPHE